VVAATHHQVHLVLVDSGTHAWRMPASHPLSVDHDRAHWCICTTIQSTVPPFMVANFAALEAGSQQVTCSIDGDEYCQASFKYQGKCLEWVCRRNTELAGADRVDVDRLLDGTGCEQLVG